MQLEKLAKKYLPMIPLSALLATAGYASGKKDNIPLPDFELTQHISCEVNNDPFLPGLWRATAKALYHPLTEENAKKPPEWRFWYSTRKEKEKASEDCEGWVALANKKMERIQEE